MDCRSKIRVKLGHGLHYPLIVLTAGAKLSVRLVTYVLSFEPRLIQLVFEYFDSKFKPDNTFCWGNYYSKEGIVRLRHEMLIALYLDCNKIFP